MPFPEYLLGRQQPDINRPGQPGKRTLQDKGNNQQMDCLPPITVSIYPESFPPNHPQLTPEAETKVVQARELLDTIVKENKG